MTSDTNEVFKQVEEKSLRERVIGSIREAIESGAIKPGSRLVEASIAEQMGISRAPVREAIQHLEQEGFVRSIPRKGSFVIELARQDIAEIYSLRSALEGLAIKLAMPSITEKEIQDLEALVVDMGAAADKRDMSQLVESDHGFHEYLVRLSNNSRLVHAWLRMSAQMRVFFMMKDKLYKDPIDIVRTHDPIIEALRSGDPELAHDSLIQHIVEAGELVIASIDEEESNIEA